MQQILRIRTEMARFDDEFRIDLEFGLRESDTDLKKHVNLPVSYLLKTNWKLLAPPESYATCVLWWFVREI